MTLEVGCLKEMRVITKEGKMIGTMLGADIDPDHWTVPTIKVEIEKDMVERLGLEKSMLKGTRIRLSTQLVELVGDIVQLNVKLAELKDSL